MSGIINYNGDKVIVNATVEKVESFTSKGGGITLKVQVPNIEESSKFFKNLQKVAKVTFEFTSAADVPAQDLDQGQLGLDDLDEALSE